MPIELKSRRFPDEMRTGEEINGNLSDLDTYSMKALRDYRRYMYWFLQARRYTTPEIIALVEHADWLIKERQK